MKSQFFDNPKLHPVREMGVKSKINKGNEKSKFGQSGQFFQFSNGVNFIIFGGKGGSGKTTCACATALHLGQKYPSKKILVVSTDPAPSLGDSFDIEIGNKITQIKGNLWAIEFDAKELLEDFRKKNLE